MGFAGTRQALYAHRARQLTDVKCPRGTTRYSRRREIVYYTLAGIVLYFVSDWLLERIEQARGKRFENRALVFFVIILVLALVSLQIVGRLAGRG